MKKIGLFYSKQGKNTVKIAEQIQKLLGKADIDIISVEDAWDDDFNKYDNILIGTSTWFDGELPSYWDELVPELNSLKFKGKKVAIFGLGNQVRYADNFVDGIGIIAEVFEHAGATIIGKTSTDGYTFKNSKAQRDNQLLGLAIDIENQNDKTEKRIKSWVSQIEKEFN